MRWSEESERRVLFGVVIGRDRCATGYELAVRSEEGVFHLLIRWTICFRLCSCK